MGGGGGASAINREIFRNYLKGREISQLADTPKPWRRGGTKWESFPLANTSAQTQLRKLGACEATRGPARVRPDGGLL